MVHTSDNPWRDVLHARFRGQPTPLLVMPDALWTAASLWAGTREWTRAFRAMGLNAGDVLVCALPAGPAFVQVLLACLWDELTFVPQRVNEARRVEEVWSCASLVIAPSADAVRTALPVLVPDDASQPPSALPERRTPASVASGHCLMCADETTGAPARYSSESVLEGSRRAAREYQMHDACILSVMPWHQSAELIDGVLASLLHADELLVAGDLALSSALRLADEHPVTHVGLSIAIAETWRAECAGSALLQRLVLRTG